MLAIICHSGGCQYLNHALAVCGRHASGVGGPLVLSKSTVRKGCPAQLTHIPLGPCFGQGIIGGGELAPLPSRMWYAGAYEPSDAWKPDAGVADM